MPPVKAKDFPLLLEVFRDGLTYGLFSRDEIVLWADQIIAKENEPDYFFIDISLSHDVNNLITTLNQYVIESKDPVPVRVILGLIYQKLIDDIINLDTAIVLTERTPFYETLTPFEYRSIYEFEEYEMFYIDDSEGLKETVVKFLSFYKDFNLTNYDRWPEINGQIGETLKVENAKAHAANEAFQKKWKKQQAKRKLIRSIPLGILFLLAITLIVIDLITFETGTIHPMRIWYINIFGVYFIARWGYTYWKQSR